MRLQSAARLYLVAIIVMASTAVTAFIWSEDVPDKHSVLLAGLFAILMIGAALIPFNAGFRANVDLGTAVIFAIALLFNPGYGALIVGLSILVANLYQRSPWDQTLFNVSQSSLQTLAGGVILSLGGWNPEHSNYMAAKLLPPMVLAAIAIFLINTLLVSIMIGLQASLAPYSIWRQSVDGLYLIEQGSQFALGLIAAIIVNVQILILPVLIFPGIMVYLAVNRQDRLRFQTLDAVNVLADLVDLRDPYTADHSRRVAIYARELATMLDLAPGQIIQIERAARVHDLGKVMIDAVLLAKSGPLTPKEWRIFEQHPVYGVQILAGFPEFSRSTLYIRQHHERIDGSGYPDGLKSGEIALGARIIAVADALDAMTSARPYRSGLPASAVIAEFQRLRGRQWDCLVVDALFTLIERNRLVIPEGGGTPVVFDSLGERVESSS